MFDKILETLIWSFERWRSSQETIFRSHQQQLKNFSSVNHILRAREKLKTQLTLYVVFAIRYEPMEYSWRLNNAGVSTCITHCWFSISVLLLSYIFNQPRLPCSTIVFTSEKFPPIGRPVQFKSLLLKGQL